MLMVDAVGCELRPPHRLGRHFEPPTSWPAAERPSSPAAAAGETERPKNRDAAAVGCSDWLAAAGISRRRVHSPSCVATVQIRLRGSSAFRVIVQMVVIGE